MRQLTKRELFFLFLLGAFFPIYPAWLLYEIRHENISILRIALLGFINAGLLPLLTAKGLRLKINFDIDQYLASNYSEAEQKKIIKNFGRYRSNFFQNTPLFTIEALNKDPNLRRYKEESFKIISKLITGVLCYVSILVLLFYLLVWL